MIRLQKQKGFTLIELLVVVAIIGMLTSVIMVSFGQSRMKSRDAKRLSDMNQVRVGLDLFFNHGNGYPDTSLWSTGQLTCDGNNLLLLPRDPLTQAEYIYATDTQVGTGCGVSVFRRYYVQFTTESNTEFGPAGNYYVSQDGITTVAPF